MTNPDLTLILTRHIAASPSAVWRCWTEPELIKQWFAPKPVETTLVEIDPVPGGAFRTVMEVPGHGTMDGGAGCILIADVAQRLVWTSALGPGFAPLPSSDDPQAFVFTADITMTAEGAGCAYVATVQHATKAAKAAHEAMGFFDGWGTAVTQLEAVAKALPKT